MDGFDEITAELRAEDRWEQEEQAREVLAAGVAEQDFATWLRRIPRGEVVALVTLDGVTVRGRVGSVGRDWIRLLEVADALGTARVAVRRERAVRFAAVASVSREWGR